MISKLISWLTSFLIRIMRLNSAGRISCRIAEKLVPIATVPTPGGSKLLMECPNVIVYTRAITIYSKEPETIEWIDEFAPGSTLLDVGANVGLFSLYAAASGHKVIAVEPESANYALLNRNICLNEFDERILAYNIALSDRSAMSILFLSEFGAGRALHTAGREVDYLHRPTNAAFRQGVCEVTLDDFVAHQPEFFPSYIKIDVDGAESRIIAGANRTLSDDRLKSVLIEINEELDCDRTLLAKLPSLGLFQVARRHGAMFGDGEFSKSFNYVFTRRPRS
jgi:FkbM family methyltransferase